MKRKDFVIIAVLILAALVLLGINKTRKEAVFCEILEYGEIVKTYDLSALLDDEIIVVNDVEILISRNGCCVNKSDCPDKICVNSGKISRAGEFIYCAPNGVLVRLSGESEADAVAY
jgi:hypothetical protein